MGFTRKASGAVGVWVAFMVCGVHQAVAGGNPPSPAVPAQPVKADTAVAEDPVLTNYEVKRLLKEGYRQEKMSNGNIQYCRSEEPLGSMIPKEQCATGAQLLRLPIV